MRRFEEDKAFYRVACKAQELLGRNPACHDWDHTLRVLHNARRLAESEHADRRVVEYAAVLHDIGRSQEMADQGLTCHAELGAGQVPALLETLGVRDVAFRDHVADCVRTHRFRRRRQETPRTLEARVVYDADKLDAIGAVGIGRAFHFAGRTGARVHNTASEALGSESYSRQDTAYREYLVKLQHVRENMLTESGRLEAENRHRFMVEFFRELEREAAGAGGLDSNDRAH